MKKIVFLTGTRADFGKLKPLIEVVNNSEVFEAYIFATGMHLARKYGYTVTEIEKCGYTNIHKFSNYIKESAMDKNLAKTIEGFSNYINKISPDLIVIHGDRIEPLAGAIVGALNNILVAHVEGGEVSGTIDELIRHAVSKMSHIHFVSNEAAKTRLIQMGEKLSNIFVIGSPDIDIMFSNQLPSLESAKKRYEIDFDCYSVVMYHPVTTEVNNQEQHAKEFVDALLLSNLNYIVVYPNNDLGSEIILKEFKRLRNKNNFKIFPSLRFEYFLVLLKNAKFIIGNSSAGIREAPYYGVPTINIGTRQQNRTESEDILNTNYSKLEILNAIENVSNYKLNPCNDFGNGNSAAQFYDCLQNKDFWLINKQKLFVDIKLKY